MFRNDTRQEEWDQIIKPKIGLFDINFRETWQYRDLIALFVRRDFIYVYKQTILGPLWYLIQPLLTTLVFTVVFSNLAKIPTDGLHPVLFYLAGTVCWNYFSESVRKTSATFVNNASLLGKVYFPRLVMPVSIVITTMFSFVVQIILLAGFIVFYSSGCRYPHYCRDCLLALVVAVDGFSRAWPGYYCFGDDCQIPRFDLSHQFFDTVADVCHTGYLFGEQHQWSGTDHIVAQPDEFNHRVFQVCFFGERIFRSFLDDV
jgi:hypothetical protein